jgi:hypothetical protein
LGQQDVVVRCRQCVEKMVLSGMVTREHGELMR